MKYLKTKTFIIILAIAILASIQYSIYNHNPIENGEDIVTIEIIGAGLEEEIYVDPNIYINDESLFPSDEITTLPEIESIDSDLTLPPLEEV